jgi:HAE1 family hydrophobic/amphiphilic exporter-1
VDREKAKSMNVALSDIFATMQVYMGSQYVNDFDYESRAYRVYVQADGQFRSNPKSLDSFYVRSRSGAMVPLAALITREQTTSPQVISHYNLFRSTELNGAAAPGVSRSSS